MLVRHGLTASTGHTLSGWTPGIHLDDRGRAQAEALATRLRELPLAAIVSSPLERCQETAAILAAGRDVRPVVDERLGECGYGDWTGKDLKTLAKDKLFRVVQLHPSAVTFPGGESLADTARRAVAAVREWNARVEGGLWVAVSHADVIKAIVADALGVHLDLFQRITVDPASLTAVNYTELRPFLLRLNDVGGAVDGLRPPRRRRGRRAADATVGGGAGST